MGGLHEREKSPRFMFCVSFVMWWGGGEAQEVMTNQRFCLSFGGGVGGAGHSRTRKVIKNSSFVHLLEMGCGVG